MDQKSKSPTSMTFKNVPETQTIDDETVKKAKTLELQGVKAAESGNLDEAIDCFSHAVTIAPHWASAYNNRAQALRLKGDIKGMRNKEGKSFFYRDLYFHIKTNVINYNLAHIRYVVLLTCISVKLYGKSKPMSLLITGQLKHLPLQTG